jgi:hypothetical protein
LKHQSVSFRSERIAPPLPGSALPNEFIRPALAEIGRTFSAALDQIVISDMIKLSEALKLSLRH